MSHRSGAQRRKAKEARMERDAQKGAIPDSFARVINSGRNGKGISVFRAEATMSNGGRPAKYIEAASLVVDRLRKVCTIYRKCINRRPLRASRERALGNLDDMPTRGEISALGLHGPIPVNVQRAIARDRKLIAEIALEA